jgi:hypothetical protein
MTDDPHASRVNWRLVYAAVLAWLVVMIVLMSLFTEAYS